MKSRGGERGLNPNLHLPLLLLMGRGLSPRGRWRRQETAVKVACDTVAQMVSPETVAP